MLRILPPTAGLYARPFSTLVASGAPEEIVERFQALETSQQDRYYVVYLGRSYVGEKVLDLLLDHRRANTQANATQRGFTSA